MNPDPYAGFPAGFFTRSDESADERFYQAPRLVTHIDEGAIASAGAVYAELGVGGVVLDLMASWISHLVEAPDRLVVLGMNADELDANPMADERVVHDLNLAPVLPFEDASFDSAICTVSVDYLTRPFEVFTEMARVLRPGGIFICTFSNRCFPTKVIKGWLAMDEVGRCDLVTEYFRRAPGWTGCQAHEVKTTGRDPLHAVWARRVEY